MEAKEFGGYLKELRKKRKLTIRQLDTYSGVSHSYISQMERGERGVPKPDILKKLSKPLGVEYEELMENAGYISKEDVIGVALSKGLIQFQDDRSDVPGFNEAITQIAENPELYNTLDPEIQKEFSKAIFEGIEEEVRNFLVDIYIDENKKNIALRMINELKGIEDDELINEVIEFAKFKKAQSKKK